MEYEQKVDTDINVGINDQRATSTIAARRTKPGKVSADTWEKLMRALYVYRLGGMDFLELLAAWEDALGITRPPTTDQP